MKKILLIFVTLIVVASFSLFACTQKGVTATSTVASETVAATTPESTQETVAAEEKPKEEYVWMASLATLPLFLMHDYPTLKQVAAELGVTITFTGPKDIDIAAQNTMLEQTIARKPAGVIFMPFGEGHNATIDKCIDAGIPLICVDGDAPNSKRIAFVGTGWKSLGAKQAKIMGDLLGGKGKVMLSAIIPNDNTVLAEAGYREVMEKEFPDIEILGINNDKGDVQLAASLAAKTIQAYPDIGGFSGIDAASGPGIAMAIREAGMTGKIHVTCVDDTPDILQAIEEGIIDATLVQKREAFEAFALKILYAYNHPGYEIGNLFAEAGFNMIPLLIYTDTMIMTKDNMSQFKEIYKYLETQM